MLYICYTEITDIPYQLPLISKTELFFPFFSVKSPITAWIEDIFSTRQLQQLDTQIRGG